MKEVYLLIVAILFVAYIFATQDDPYVPIDKREKPIGSKRKIINYYSWRGPMFIEDFDSITMKDSGSIDSTYACSEKAKFLDHDLGQNDCGIETCEEHELWKQKFRRCNQVAMFKSRTQPSTMTSQDSWDNEYHNSSFRMRGPNPKTGDLGNFAQTTNNNLDVPNQLKCVNNGRWDGDTCSATHLVSKVCYKAQLDKCMNE